MKKALGCLLFFLLLPILCVIAVIYAVSNVLELLFRAINLGIDYAVLWVQQKCN